MIVALRGAVALVLAGSLAACGGSANTTPAKGSVFLIERKCNIVETTTSSDGRKSARGYEDDCKSIEAWEDARAKRDKTISAKAVVKVSYTAPQDGSYRSAELKFDSRDDEFYDLKAGDEIDILVHNDNLDKITKS